MKQILIALFILFFNIILSGQNTISPYSIFGPGELQSKGFGKSSAMGGAGIALKSGNSLNNINPASYTGLDSLRIIFEFGVEGKLYKLSSAGKSNTGYTGNFNYMALGFKYTDWLAGSFGIVPFSSVGYSISKDNYVEGMSDTYSSTFVGSGGISQFYFANAIKLYKNLSLGINTSFLFGALTQEENINATNVVPQLQIVRQDFLKSFYFEYGLQYSFSTKKMDYTVGVTYSNEQNLKSNHNLIVYDESYSLVQSERYNTDYLKVPQNFGVGLGVEKENLFSIFLDYNFQKWSGIEYPIQINDFKNSHGFNFGGEFRPWGNRAINSSFKSWVYRFGLSYNTSNLSFGNKIIDKRSITFGAGIPLPGRISDFNWGVEIGTNGTLSNQLIHEKFIMFQLGFSLNEVAFLRRKFD